MLERVIQLAIENDYDSAEYDGEWNGYRVYVPIFLDDEPHFTGIPEIILEKDGLIRFGTSEEDKAYLKYKTPPLSQKLIKKCLKILNETA